MNNSENFAHHSLYNFRGNIQPDLSPLAFLTEYYSSYPAFILVAILPVLQIRDILVRIRMANGSGSCFFVSGWHDDNKKKFQNVLLITS